jgi:DNA-3-methyladenine glycosylase I
LFRQRIEINQARLSWLTILKREAFRKAYDDFAIERVAGYGARGGCACWRMRGSSATGSRSTPPSPMPPAFSTRESHGSFSAGFGHIIAPEAEWVKLFKKTFRFTGGEIVGEFLLSTGFLPGARTSCPYTLVC